MQAVRHLTHIAPYILATTASVSGWAQTSGSVAAGPVRTNDVEFRSRDVALSGTVILPPKIWAAAVLVQGSGQAGV
jgi:hypothetical protein